MNGRNTRQDVYGFMEMEEVKGPFFETGMIKFRYEVRKESEALT